MIILHHLRIGRSIFTVWLLEELGLDYELRVYLRNEMGRAQDDLKMAHPLGKSPVIEDGPIKLSESGAITAYLIETYTEPGQWAPDRADKAAWARYLQWLHYPEGSVFAPLLMTMLLKRGGEAPALLDGFAKGEVDLHLGYMAQALDRQPFILGSQISGADFGLTYVVSMANRLGLIEGYPALQAYLDRNTGRPAFRRAIDRAVE